MKVETAAPPARPGQKPRRIVGTSVPRADGVEKVTGQARYTGDLTLPGMLYGKVLRSPYAHARIRGIDATRALALPGVVAVLTGADLQDINPYYGHAMKDRPVIAIGRARFVGDPVAAVAAESEEIAEDALELIAVDYEELHPMPDVDTALGPDAVPIHETGPRAGDLTDAGKSEAVRHPNICHHRHDEHGDVDAAFAAAAHIAEDEFRFPYIYQYAMEPFTVLAEWAGNRLRVWSSAQHTFLVRADLADVFRLPLSQVSVSSPFLGGGFGSKSYTKHEPLVAALARKAGRPVLVEFSVAEAFQTNRRHATVVRMRTAVDAEGHILAREAQAYLDSGAYADNGPKVASGFGQKLLGIYHTPAYRIDSYAVYTNLPPAGSYRAPGGPQAIWSLESQMDIIAHHLGMDPLQLRLRNARPEGEIVTPGRRPMDTDVTQHLRIVGERAQEAVAGAAAGAAGDGAAPQARGQGMAAVMTAPGAGPVAISLVRLFADGTALVHAGATEMGQGARTVLAQLAAEELTLPMAAVRVSELDSEMVPFNRSTGASRSTTVLGSAVVAAVADLKTQLFQIAAPVLESAPEDLELADGEVVAATGRRMPLANVVQKLFGMRGGELIGRGYSGPGLLGGRLDSTPVFWEIAVGCADIAVDAETGAIRLERYISLADVGLAVNPQLVKGQETGAFLQGVGHTLFEEIIVENGQMLNSNLVDYRVPTFPDMPERFESILVENQDGPGPYGLKGAGEAALVPVSAAVGNALFRATGVRIRQLPLTPERVWRALRDKAE